jgi:hypothetical protein
MLLGRSLIDLNRVASDILMGTILSNLPAVNTIQQRCTLSCRLPCPTIMTYRKYVNE